MNELLSLSRTAQRVGVSKKWLRDQAEAGKIPCLNLENRLLFNPVAVIEVLAARAGNPVNRLTDDLDREVPHDA